MKRRQVIDVMRGFLLWQSFFADALVGALHVVPASAAAMLLAQCFTHMAWNGYSWMDGGFGAYMMLIGASMVFSYEKAQANGVTKSCYFRHILSRAALLWLFAFFYDGGGFSVPIEKVVFTEIFYELAVCILLTGILLITIPPRWYFLALAIFLLAHTLFLTQMQVPGYGAGDFTKNGNAEYYIRSHIADYIAGLWHINRGPDSFADAVAFYVSLVKLIGTCLTGLILGQLLRSDRSYSLQALILFLVGVFAICAAFIWNIGVPFNKHLWTPSFVVLNTGIVCMLLAAFIYIAEIWRWQRVVTLFTVFGRHSLLAWVCFFYLLPFGDMSNRLFGEVFRFVFGAYAPIPMVFAPIILCWAFFYWLQKRGILKASD